jgi:hypothetical protein
MPFCSVLKPHRCDACDYRTQRRVRVHLVADASWKHWTTAGLLVCPECATYLIEEGIATKAIRPRGIRKAGRGEFARCSRFAD